MGKSWQTLLVCLTVLVLDSKVSAISKPVIAGLQSKWPNTPVILEASEFLADENAGLFWSYVDTVVNFGLVNSVQSARTMYEASLKAAKMVLNDGDDSLKIKLLKLSLSLRAYSPRIEMFNQVAKSVDPTGCDLFFDVHGKVVCDFKQVHQIVKSLKENNNAPAVFKQDHVYPVSQSLNRSVVLYGNIEDPQFKDAHEFMKRLANEGIAKYVFRHFIRARPKRKARLSGYGVELALKSTEYKALDDSKVKDDSEHSTSENEDDIEIEGFDFPKLRKLHPNLSEQLTKFRNHLTESTNEMAPMKVWQLQDLSFQAAARVLSSPPEEQMKVLKDISLNFPIKVRSLVKQQVSDDIRGEIKINQQRLQGFELDAGDSLFLLNGLQIDVADSDMFKILDVLHSEGRLIDGLKKLDLNSDDIQKMMRVNLQNDVPENYMLDIRDKSIMWLNDVENDEKYSRWPSNLHEMLRPAFPGTLRRIRKNMFHLVIVCDPTHEDMKYLVESAEIFWANDVPLRIGFSMVVDDSPNVDGNKDAGVALVRAYNYAKDELDDSAKTFSFFAGIFKSLGEDDVITVEHVKERLKKKFKDAELDDIFGPDSEYDEQRKLGKAFYARSGLTGEVNVLLNGMLLTEDDISPDNFEQVVIEKILDATSGIQRAVYMGNIDNKMNVFDYLMTRPGVVSRFNEIILKAEDNYLSFLGFAKPETTYWKAKEFSELSSTDKTATLAKFLGQSYISKSDGSKFIRPVTMWLVADVESEDGRAIVYHALKHVKSSSHTRLAIIHNLKMESEVNNAMFARAYEVALATQSANNARNFITKLMKEENARKIVTGEKTFSDYFVGGMDKNAFEKLMTQPEVAVPQLAAHLDWSVSVLGLRRGQTAVVANGKVIGPLEPDEKFASDDFHLIESLIYSTAAKTIDSAVKSFKKELTAPQGSDLIMKLNSHLASQPKSDLERRDLSNLRQQHSVIKIAGTESETSPYDITLVVDPASEKAQEIIPIVMVLHEALGANVKIYMNCREKLSELPIKRFYRYVIEPELKFKVDNSMSDGPHAKFIDLPSKSILTLTMHPPEGWLVEVVKAVHDLDNIKLEKVDNSVQAEYELECFALEGHAKDLTSGTSPRGLQFTLGVNSSSVSVDTIVMANLGYFQLKTTPGVWHLNLRAGRSREIYQITSHENTDSSHGRNDVIVLMDSFKSKVISVKVSKKPEMVDVALLDEEESSESKQEDKNDSGGIWNSIANTLTGGSSDNEHSKTSGDDLSANGTDVLNIFSLASGHLYERLMRIMMLSVLRHTKTPVKFWVLKNYISPQFKDFIPRMAEEYGFDFEMVQYKWPRWLRQQKEKQRTMWGYKILFLDVLFPLGVDKIIFVDADQIVRADLKELRDMDLEGNPYGYTPFCDDKKEMDGFRFWKGGYWASHLAGRKYHISAIYVVDLKKFRRIAAGDRLRGQYQGLSQDPNSLANLDQDLPNNMIHQVGIKSLPQEWLWCATWCSEESRQNAKTIDLCNNPLTKEPKLTAAVRIVAEWPEYDNEIKALQERLSNSHTIPKKSEPDEKQRITHEDL